MSPTDQLQNIAIVGAGLIGRLIALSLHRQGFSVTLFDKDDKNGHQSAAYAAAGLLTPLGEAFHSPENIVAMGFESLKLWPKLLSTLDEHVYFQQRGAIMVSHEQDKGTYHHHARFLANHLPKETVHHLNRQSLEQLEPELARSFHQGMYLPDEGQIGNRRLLIALRKQLEQEQVTWLANHLVIEIKPTANKTSIRYVHENKEQSCDFDLVIDCRGTGARKTSSSASTAALKDLRAVRGELFQLFAPQVNISRPVRLMHPRYQLYIAPKSKGFYVVGATEIESDDSSPMTVRSAMELLSAAYSVHPGFAEANIRQHVSQCRPAFSDNQPQICLGQRLIQVNGLYRHGFLIAPVVLQQISELVAQLSANNPNQLFDSNASITRFLNEQSFTYSPLLSIKQN